MRSILSKIAVTLLSIAGVVLTQAGAAHGSSFNWR
jgi:hypothetical protein